MRAGLLVSSLLVAATISACTQPPHPVTSTTASAAVELANRAAHTATALTDGSVLVAGGCDVTAAPAPPPPAPC